MARLLMPAHRGPVDRLEQSGTVVREPLSVCRDDGSVVIDQDWVVRVDRLLLDPEAFLRSLVVVEDAGQGIDPFIELVIAHPGGGVLTAPEPAGAAGRIGTTLAVSGHDDPEVLRVHRLAELARTAVEDLDVDPDVLHHRLERLRDRGFGRVVTEGRSEERRVGKRLR